MAKLRHLALETLLFGTIIVLLIVWHVGLSEILSVIMKASIVFLLLYLITSFLIALMHTWKWQLVLHSQNYHVPYVKLFMYRLVGYSVGYLTPTTHAGSEPIRAFLLRREGIPKNEAFSNVIIEKSIELLANVIFFFLGALLVLNSVTVQKSAKITILVLSLLFMLVTGALIAGILNKNSMFVGIFKFFRLNKIRQLHGIEKTLAGVEEQVEKFYREKKDYFIGVVLIMVVLWALMFVEYRYALLILGHEATLVEIFLILTGVGLAYAVPVPAAMGALELGQLSAAKVLQMSAVTGIALAFLVRARDLLWTFFGLIFLLLYHFDFIKLAKETHRIDKEMERGRLPGR